MAYNPPIRAAAYEFYVSLVSAANTREFQANPTLAAGDVKVYKDGGASANITTLPSALASGKVVKVNLSGTEMTADNVTVVFSDQTASEEWCDLLINIQPLVWVPGNVTYWNGTAIPGVDTAGYPKVTVKDGTGTGEIDTNGGKVLLADAAVDAIWDEVASGHVTAGSTGKALSDAQDGDYVGGSATAATNAARAFQGLVLGTAITGTLSTTAFTTDLTEATNDHYNGRTLTFTSGVLAGQMTTISDYNGTTKLVTVATMTEAPGNGDAFFIA